MLQLALVTLGQACGEEKSRCSVVEIEGSWDQQTYVPTAGCYYGVPTPSETFEILRGSWLFFVGGSNTWTLFQGASPYTTCKVSP